MLDQILDVGTRLDTEPALKVQPAVSASLVRHALVPGDLVLAVRALLNGTSALASSDDHPAVTAT